MPAGSYLTVSEATRDIDTAAQFVPRTHAEILRYFAGLELVEPGLVPLPEWRGLAKPAEWIPAYGGVARKP